MNTPDGPGVTLHPVVPGHPEKTWWILFRRFAESFEVDEIEELGVSMGESRVRPPRYTQKETPVPG